MTGTGSGPEAVQTALRAPGAAAFAGIAFAVLLGTALVCLRLFVPADIGDLGLDPGRRQIVLFALGLVPFAGIAFLWFIGVIRDRIGAGEDKLFATVFLGSGLLFLAMLFTTTAIATAMVATAGADAGRRSDSEILVFAFRTVSTMNDVFTFRMAAVFTITTTTLVLRLKLAPRWLVVLGYATALVLLFTASIFPWSEILFPAWVFVLSAYLLIALRMRSRSREPLPVEVAEDAALDLGDGR